VTFTGIMEPEELAILATALKELCRLVEIEPGTPAYEEAARVLMFLYINGATTIDDLEAGVKEWSQRTGRGL
jgi:hypothetical protein